MSRRKKSRTMRGKLNVKTGSKKDFIQQGELGKIPSHNRLEKHKKKKQKSAYQRYLEEKGLPDTSAGQQQVRQRIQQAEASAKAADTNKVETTAAKRKDFDQLSGDELLDLLD